MAVLDIHINSGFVPMVALALSPRVITPNGQANVGHFPTLTTTTDAAGKPAKIARPFAHGSPPSPHGP